MTDVADLKRQLDAAYAAIQELDDDLAAGRVSSTDHAELKQRSERHAATILTRLRDAEREAAGARQGREAAPRRSLGARLASPLAFGVGAALLLTFGVVLGVLVARFTSEDRSAAALAGAGTSQGQLTTPAGVVSPAEAARSGQPLSPALEARLKDVEVEKPAIPKLLEFARMALDEGRIPPAIWAYKRVLAQEPKNVEAITNIAVILAEGNHLDEALNRLDEAIRIDPRSAPAQWARAQVLLNGKKDYREAIGALESFLRLVPNGKDAERARTMLADARRLATGAAAKKPPAGR